MDVHINAIDIRTSLVVMYDGAPVPIWALRDCAQRLASNESFQLWIAGKVQDDGYTPKDSSHTPKDV